MKNKILIPLLIFLVVSTKLSAQDFKVNINKLTEETQQLSESPDTMRLVWWIPTEFWQTIFEQDNAITRLESDEMLINFEKYTMVAVIDGDIKDDGTITYKTEETTFKNLTVIGSDKVEYTPLYNDEIDEDTNNLIRIMKPMLGNMLGALGQNMHFYLFQKRDNPLDKIVNPINKESFTVKLDTDNFNWSLPLGSLLKPKKCPEDNKLHNGAWNYCPYHGKKLEIN